MFEYINSLEKKSLLGFYLADFDLKKDLKDLKNRQNQSDYVALAFCSSFYCLGHKYTKDVFYSVS